ncbi:MAG TPA: serine hydrolase domain-containing protein [Thermoanaerobaculia bacterium]|jgi:CubicO group peptidase (beta-lactamase class C family)
MRRSVFSVLALACLSAALPAASDAPDTKARVDAVFKDFDRSDSPGCALGVYREGKILYARGYGMANLELGVANSPQTAFDLGSTSKQFTAMSIHLLVREGKLSLDDDIRKWLPELPDYGKAIKVRNLLHHTSGLRDYLELMGLQGVKDEDLTTEEDALAILSRQKSLNFPPGTEHLYSNSGYFLLSVIVKRASGMSLRDFAAERIFGPLGMRHTQFNDSHTRIIPNRATGYRRAEGGGFGIDMSDFEQTGDGSVLTSVEDLFHWDQNFYEPRVGDRQLLDAMLTPGVLENGRKLEYASALVVSSYRGLPTVSHGGAWVGYRAQLLRFPEQKLSVACLCNLADSNPSGLARQVAEVYLESLMKKEAPPSASKTAGSVRLAEPLEKLERLSGQYRNASSGETVRVGVKEGKLIAETGDTHYVLTAVSPNRYVVEGYHPPRSREVTFEAVSGSARPRMRIVTRQENGEEERELFEPVETWTPTAAQLNDFAGTYTSEELETAWRLTAEDGKLLIRHRGLPAKPLTPTITDGFTLEGMNITFTRDASKKVTGFRLDEGRVRGIAFVRQS